MILILLLFLVLCLCSVAYRIARGVWIPAWVRKSEEPGNEHNGETGSAQLSVTALPTETMSETASGLVHPIKEYMDKKDEKIDTLNEILHNLKQDNKTEADRNTDFIAMLEIVADGVSSALAQSYISLEKEFEIDYAYVVDSIQSAMANEIVRNPGVAVFITDPDDPTRLRPHIKLGLDPHFQQYRPGLNVKSPEGFVWLNEQTKYWPNIRDSEEMFEECPPKTRSMIASPLFVAEEKLGILTISSDSVDGFWRPMDPRYAAAFAKVFGALLYIDLKGIRTGEGR